MGGNLCSFFSRSEYGFFSTMDDQAMHDEWRHGSGSTSSAGGRGSNPTSASEPSVPYRGQRVAFPSEYFVPQDLEAATPREPVDAVGVEEEVDWDMGQAPLLVYKRLLK